MNRSGTGLGSGAIAVAGFDLGLNRYKEVARGGRRDPKEILKELWKLEEEIQAGMRELEAML